MRDSKDERDETDSLVKYFELIAFAGGIWYVISNFIFGPLTKLLKGGDPLRNEPALQVLESTHQIVGSPTKVENQ